MEFRTNSPFAIRTSSFSLPLSILEARSSDERLYFVLQSEFRNLHWKSHVSRRHLPSPATAPSHGDDAARAADLPRFGLGMRKPAAGGRDARRKDSRVCLSTGRASQCRFAGGQVSGAAWGGEGGDCC